jgi:hypothetical protein
MSHSEGQIWSRDGKFIGFFEYNGTVDVVCGRVYRTSEEMDENWRQDNHRRCKCGAEGAPAVLYTNYGNGFYWDGRVCLECMAVADGLMPEETTDGHPFFRQSMALFCGAPVLCPKCGRDSLQSDGNRYPIKCGGCDWGGYFWQTAWGNAK